MSIVNLIDPTGAGRGVHHDSESRNYPIRRSPRAAATPLTTKLWDYYGPTLDQFYLGSCTGHAKTMLLNHGVYGHLRPRVRTARPYLQNDFAVQLYSEATRLDPWPGAWPPEDTGSSGLAAAKALKNRGLITGYLWAFSFEEALQGLMTGPLAVGSWWRSDMMETDANGFVSYSGDYVGGHEWVLRGVNMRDEYLHGMCAWGADWPKPAKKSRFKITFDAFRELMHEDGDIVMLVP